MISSLEGKNCKKKKTATAAACFVSPLPRSILGRQYEPDKNLFDQYMNKFQKYSAQILCFISSHFEFYVLLHALLYKLRDS